MKLVWGVPKPRKWVRRAWDAKGVFVVGAIVLVVPFSLAIICHSWAPDRMMVLFDGRAAYRYVCQCRSEWMWAIAFLSLLVALYLTCARLVHGELARMRHAIASLLLIGLAVASASIFAWDWLGSGDDSNSATVRNIAIGFAAVLAPIFVIWREKIASGKATSDRYEKAVQMLDDPNPAVCIAGVGIMNDLCRYPAYRKMSLAVLNAFVEDPAPRQTGGRMRSRAGAVKEAKSVIAAWSNG